MSKAFLLTFSSLCRHSFGASATQHHRTEAEQRKWWGKDLTLPRLKSKGKQAKLLPKVQFWDTITGYRKGRKLNKSVAI